MKTKILLLTLLLSASILGFSTTWTITNSGTTFTPATITITVGDTVNFVVASVHNVREVSETTWNENENIALDDGFETPFGGGLVLPEQLGIGTHYFVCIPHAALGMKGTIIVEGSTGISENQLKQHISVFPNPASNLITIKSSNNLTSLTYIISDQTGRQVLSGKLNNETTPIDINKFPAGTYFILVGKQRSNTFKLIKK